MDTLAARQQMVDQQIRTWEVLDPRVLDALLEVPREAFVPDAYRDLAFADAPLPIGHGQSMLAPKIQGRILQALGIDASDRALEVGTGSGYLSACLSLLAGVTHSIEIHADLTALATAKQRAVIALTGSMPVYDSRFERALRPGGRLFAIVGSAPVMDAMLVRRVDYTEWIRESLFETVVDPLINATAAQGFVF
jgi:protein-L-isoaspartate(D-aspartate) O-methyltransferase